MSNNTSLDRFSDATESELAEVSAGMQRYIRAADGEARQAEMEALGRRGLLKRLFPNEVEREQQRIAVQSMRQFADSRREMLAIFSTAQLEIARKRADALVAAQGVAMQAGLAKFAYQKIEELNDTLNESRERFMAKMKPQFAIIAGYDDLPQLAVPAQRSLDRQIESYFDTTEILLNGFTESLRTRVAEGR